MFPTFWTRQRTPSRSPSPPLFPSTQAGPVRQARPVFEMYTQTGLPSISLNHSDLVIGYPKSHVFVSGISKVDKFDREVRYHSRHMYLASLSKSMQLRGFTEMTDDEIKSNVHALIGDFGKYNPISNNCHTFSRRLLEIIIMDNLHEPDDTASYCLLPQYAHFINHSIGDYRGADGYIRPDGKKVLCHVKQTKEDGVWIGQVRGTDETGKFFAYAFGRLAMT